MNEDLRIRSGSAAEAIQAKTTKIFSSTNQSNEPMQKVLASLGYVPSGVIDNLDEGDPGLIFMKQLPRNEAERESSL